MYTYWLKPGSQRNRGTEIQQGSNKVYSSSIVAQQITPNLGALKQKHLLAPISSVSQESGNSLAECWAPRRLTGREQATD